MGHREGGQGGPGCGGKNKAPARLPPPAEAELEAAAAGEHAFIRLVTRRTGALWRVTKTAEQKIGVQFAVHPAQRSAHSRPRQAPLRFIINNNTTRLHGPFSSYRPRAIYKLDYTEARTCPPAATPAGTSATLFFCVTHLGDVPNLQGSRPLSPQTPGSASAPTAVPVFPGIHP